ncbi:HK97 family phage prohead protease [Paraburkholderia mimosarum]|uniref:HK97 family phage prohead protease n=1 Tax=Paraburkholderia mimosarum TaxID=312026 RepID=UPI0039C3E309
MRSTFMLELKAVGDNLVEGHAAIFDNVDLGGDRIAPTAFDGTLQSWKARGKLPPLLYEHRDAIGGIKSLSPDSKGLAFRAQLATQGRGAEAMELVRLGAISGASFGYRIELDHYNADTGVTDLLALDLFEVSLTATPMNPATDVSAIKSLRDCEAVLRDAGLSRGTAQQIIAAIKAADDPRDSVDAAMLLATIRQRATVRAPNS